MGDHCPELVIEHLPKMTVFGYDLQVKAFTTDERHSSLEAGFVRLKGDGFPLCATPGTAKIRHYLQHGFFLQNGRIDYGHHFAGPRRHSNCPVSEFNRPSANVPP